jgi:hypothetical protein
VKEAAAVQTAVAKDVENATNQAKPANINTASPSPTVTVKITAAPFTMTAVQPTTVKQGTKFEIPITIARLYGFADAVTVRAKLAGGAKGINVPEISIAADQTEAKLVVDAAADAAPGTFPLGLQAVSRFNGQELSLTQDVPLTVEAAAK